MSARLCRTFAPAAYLVLLLVIPRALSARSLTANGALPPAQDASQFSLDGKITEAAPGKLTINTQDNILFHVRYDDKTEIKRAGGSDGSAKDLTVGARVHVVGDLQESGEIAATRIALQDNASKKP
jgi:Domain of unknown function (DUF5666)